MDRDTLYFDGQCPLCSFEMDHLRRMGDGSLRLVDVHSPDLLAESVTDLPDKESLLGVLHLRTREGEWLRGIDASVRAWQSTRVGFIWRILRAPLIGPIADRVYEIWAVRRYRRLYGRDCPAKQQV